MNGDFRVHQRGTASVTTNGGFFADRWFASTIGGSRTAQRVTLDATSRSAIGSEGATTAVQYAATGGTSAGDHEIMIHRVEGVRTFAGKWTTLSFWARRTAGSGNLVTEVAQYTGDSGVYIPEIGNRRHTLTTSWQRFSYSFYVPRAMDLTYGTTGDYVQMLIWLSGGTNWNSRTLGLGPQTITVQITEVQWETGIAATPFERRSLPVEMQMCQRFGVAMDLQAQANQAGNYLTPFYFPVLMRATPTAVNLSAGSSSNATVSTDGARDNGGGYFQINATAAGGFVINRRTFYTAEA